MTEPLLTIVTTLVTVVTIFMVTESHYAKSITKINVCQPYSLAFPHVQVRIDSKVINYIIF